MASHPNFLFYVFDPLNALDFIPMLFLNATGRMDHRPIRLVQSIIGRGVESFASFSHTPERIKIRFLVAITSLTEGEDSVPLVNSDWKM
jgi:hypothetical protein